MLLASALALLAGAAPAWAHEEGSHSGFAARVSVIEPFLPGLLVQVVSGHEKLSVANLTDKPVVILDDAGGPLVRVGPGKTEVWAEPRIGSDEEPPEEEGLVRNWQIAGTTAGERFEIRGFLGYRAPADATEDEDREVPIWGLAALLAAATLALAAAVALRRIAARSA